MFVSQSWYQRLEKTKLIRHLYNIFVYRFSVLAETAQEQNQQETNNFGNDFVVIKKKKKKEFGINYIYLIAL